MTIIAASFIAGLELSERFYADVVAPILQGTLDDDAYSAALIGYGSEVQGFDTPRSTDHAWGPRLQIFLDADAFRDRADELHDLMERELPRQFCGHPVRFALPDGAPPRHWVHITDLAAFFTAHLGVPPARTYSVSTWLTVPTQVLRKLTGGRVFHDGLAVLEGQRRALRWYPDGIWRYILACQWLRLSQEEPFAGRCGELGDDLGSAVVTARQVRELMKLLLLMDRVYPPYSKWLGTAFAQTERAEQVGPHLTGALAASTWQERERHLSAAYMIAAELHNERRLTAPLDPKVRPFHSRPFQVLDAHRFTKALMDTITDPQLKALPPVGAIDQYVDSTDMTDRVAAGVRREYINGPTRLLRTSTLDPQPGTGPRVSQR